MIINNIFKCTQEEFDRTKSRETVTLVCTECYKDYKRTKKEILDTFTKNETYPKFCSKNCLSTKKHRENSVTINCYTCDKQVTKILSKYNNSKNHFCSQSCAASYSNKNKKTGSRRSKIEVFFEERLTELFPNLKILYSIKTVINSELDIYIPDLNLAFEIQGIFHYQPIYGQEKLEQIQKNDLDKIQKCDELGIDLIHINVSQQKHFKEESSIPYLEIIKNHIIKRETQDSNSHALLRTDCFQDSCR